MLTDCVLLLWAVRVNWLVVGLGDKDTSKACLPGVDSFAALANNEQPVAGERTIAAERPTHPLASCA